MRYIASKNFPARLSLMNGSSATVATIGGSDTDRRPEKPSIPALNHVIASVNIRLPGCIVLRSSWGKVLIRLPFRVVGLDISESPRRSIVLGPRRCSPALSFSPLIPCCCLASSRPRFSSCLALTRTSLYTSPPFPRSSSLSVRSESSRPEVIRCLEKHRRGGSRGGALSRWGF